MATRRSPTKPSPATPVVLAPSKAVGLLGQQLERADALPGQLDDERTLQQWMQTARSVVVGAFGEPSPAVERFDQAGRPFTALIAYASPSDLAEGRRDRLAGLKGVLRSCIEQLEMGLGGTTQANEAAEAASRVVDAATSIGFLRDDDIGRLVKRDLHEIAVAVSGGAWKAALLLCGSTLEAVLIDVLDRRPDISITYMKKARKFPDDASLGDLVAIAADPNLIGDGRYLLSRTAAGLAGTIIEHRDLVHPHAELRGRMAVDKITAEALVHLLGVVVRDLAAADKRGDISAYEAK